MENYWLIGKVVESRASCLSSLLIKDGKIQKISDKAEGNEPKFYSPDCFILPGLIELHIHGAVGCDFTDGSAKGNQKVANFLARQGIAAYVAAIVSSPHKETIRAIETLAKFRPKGPRLLGILLEGPFIAPDKRGAHRLDCLQEPNIERAKEYLSIIPDDVQPIVLVAPELPRALDFIEELQRLGAIVALGHSAADYETTKRAIDAGSRYGIHLWNAMAPLNHRQPGIVGALLTDERAYVEIIGDLLHLHESIVKLSIKAKSTSKVALVTDMTGPAGLPRGEHSWNDQKVTVTDRDIRLADGTLAGSNTTNEKMLQALGKLGYSLCEMTKMRSSVPAKIIGTKTKNWGKLKVGNRANLTILDDNLRAIATIVDGKFVYPSSRTRLTALFKS